MTDGEARHLQRVKELPCVLCDAAPPSDAHHIKEGRAFGDRDEFHFLTLPLCKSCHQGPLGVHGDQTMLRITKKGEIYHLGRTLKKLYGGRK